MSKSILESKISIKINYRAKINFYSRAIKHVKINFIPLKSILIPLEINKTYTNLVQDKSTKQILNYSPIVSPPITLSLVGWKINAIEVKCVEPNAKSVANQTQIKTQDN